MGQEDGFEDQIELTVANEQDAQQLISRTEGWVANAHRVVEVYCEKSQFTLKVAKSVFFITKQGEMVGKRALLDELTRFDREVILGPAIVFALALRSVWSLHGSAATYAENTIIFLAESGVGKSTLAAYLARVVGWHLVADDILPVREYQNKLIALPRFPQLKLPVDAQPGMNLPERLRLNILCELVPADADVFPEIKQLPPEQAVTVLLHHTAGTRLFDAKMLESHLAFCSRAAEIIPVYQLNYPHSKDALPKIKEMLESLC